MQNEHIDTDRTDLTGVLLVGGRSRRMGRDKALLRLQGEPLYRRGLRALAMVAGKLFLAGDRPDLAGPGLPFHSDRFPGSALGGVETALRHSGSEWVAMLPCDLPYPSPRLLQALLSRRDEVDAVLPRTAQGVEPLIGCYHRRLLPLVEEQLVSGRFRITDLLARVRVRYLDESELPAGWRRALLNLNTPAALRSLFRTPPAVTLVARSGTGKTTLLETVIGELTRRGWTIGALKHDAHRFDIDHPGKDSWRFTNAGAAVTAISAADKSAIIVRHDLEPPVSELLRPYTGRVDLILTEGFKQSSLPKIEVHRAAVNQPLLCRGESHDPTLLAVASDTRLVLDVPCLDLNRPGQVADFIEQRFLR